MADTGFKSPTDTGDIINEWRNPTNAYSSNNSFTDNTDYNDEQDYSVFELGVPASATINGIEVTVEWKSATEYHGNAYIGIKISYDGGSSKTTEKNADTDSATDITSTFGGATDTWGRSWLPSEFSDANFWLFLIDDDSDDIPEVDHIQVKVYYTEASTELVIVGLQSIAGAQSLITG